MTGTGSGKPTWTSPSEDLVERAKARASPHGEVVGLVSRVTPISHGNSNREIRADIPYQVHLSKRFLVGSYLGISILVSGTLALGRISAVERADILAISRVPALSPVEDSSGVTTPLTVTLELLSELVYGEVVPPSSPVDPQSPIFVPNPEFLKRMLGLPGEGIQVGWVVEGYRQLDVPVRLTHDLLRHHVLVVGTTGAGKTNLLRLITLRSQTPLMVLDIQGDYVKAVAEAGGTILVPVTRDYQVGVGDFVEEFKRRSGLPSYSIESVKGPRITMRGEEGKRFNLHLTALRFNETYPILADVAPFFSAQGAYFFKLATKGCEPPVDRWEEECLEVLEQQFSLHRSTVDNIRRSVVMLRESGILDVRMGERGEIYLGEPDYWGLIKEKTVVDLRWAMERGVTSATTVAFVLIDRIFNLIDQRFKRMGEETPYLLVFDEAHEYFPQGGRGEEGKEALERLINRIMRLGRVRGIGTVLATHRPTDLNDLILTLTNTKVALRADEDALKRIGMEDYVGSLQASPAGYGVMRTFSLRVKDLFFRTERFDQPRGVGKEQGGPG